ncbi:MAG TPA: iron ABC transporter permease [Ohtaekwangia sp.]|uniref:iron ABC transporter permease n=1 Tax=Ohtaekwangia sp. TaxID=2066019 RepID=UPI002F95E1DF
MNNNRWPFLPFLLILLFGLNLSLGSVHIPFREIISILTGHESSEPVWKDIVWNFRITKALTCVLAGGALALAGLQMQTLFRNALAGPDVLGLSSGASLAVALIFMSQAAGLPFLTTPSPWTVAIAASMGCTAVFLIMLAISRKLRDNVSLLIIGLMIGAGTSSVVSVLQYISRAEEMQTYLIWTFGSLGGLNWRELTVLGIVLFAGAAIALGTSKSLNAWMLGDNYALSIGINIKRSRFWIILSASILTGGVTAFCGPIAFVGLAVPHLVKLLIPTTNHKILIPMVMMGGAVLMLFCDILSQLPGSTQVLPINAITALIGAPVVIGVIMRHSRINP